MSMAASPSAGGDPVTTVTAGADARRRRSERTLHLCFYLVLFASAFRYTAWHGVALTTLPALAGGAGLGVLYLFGLPRVPARPGLGRQVWLLATIAYWTVLTVSVASYAWCAVPLFFLVLRILPTWAALPVIAELTLVAGLAEVTLAKLPFPFDPSPMLAPVAIAVMSTVIYRQLHRENSQRQALIDDLVSTRDALARSERSAGVLQERARLSQEIHDTIAQGLSSMHLLLNAADQDWTAAPDQARAYVRQAAVTARDNLAEARRFIRDLAPPDLDGRSLTEAIGRVCNGTAEHAGIDVDLRVDGTAYPVGVDVEIALLRVTQGALANVAEHAKASTAVVTLTYLPDEVTLDVCDDGVGFDPAAPPAKPDRGFGLRAIRQRVEALGGATTVESAPAEGTVLAVSLPATDEPSPQP
jgi:signal transduction histidine kinase